MSGVMLVVIDHGLGNIGSLCNTLNFLGIKHSICRLYEPEQGYTSYTGFILPGVGAFNAGMKRLKERSLDKLIKALNNDNIPGMGICLGMQMLCCKSEEGGYTESGLSIIKGKVVSLEPKNGMVPSIGWRETIRTSTESSVVRNGDYYYVHSYQVITDDPSATCAYYKHGNSQITAAIKKNNILGVQFHPEKSQGIGLDLITNFFKNQ